MSDVVGESEGPSRLHDIDFTDLFFSERGETLLRGTDDADPLVPVPASAMRDLSKLHVKVCERGRTEPEFHIDYDGMRFRVCRTESTNGVWYTLSRAMWPIPRLGEMVGIPARVIEYLGLLGLEGKHGLILIAGATRQGKTTTACSLLQDYLICYGEMAITCEDPVELPLHGHHGRAGFCIQTHVKDGNFTEAMKLTMRRAPRYILLGEVRSYGEASEALRAAINGHLVITTIHAGNVIQAIDAMVKLVSGREPVEIARSNLASGLLGVMHQKLHRAGNRRVIVPEFLFPGRDAGIRNMIRTGKTEQLVTAIEAQASRVAQGKTPIAE